METVKCQHCGADIDYGKNPTGPEVWSEGGENYGCLQRAFDEWDGQPTDFGDEPEAPYPPHEPEAATS